ncbi:MAG: hypothetical protein EON60_06835 [Alphaproteobacteria bacterium]|nr:MAG: hypothetical protein EON60_06835 [Alphaproteobacteria bacterium]
MRNLNTFILTAAAIVATANLAHAEDLNQCDFNKPKGTCSPAFSLDKSRNEYSIGATGQCQIATVQIDGTPAPHRMKNTDVIQQLTIFDKKKDYTVTLNSCTAYPTKDETKRSCLSLWDTHKGQCFAVMESVRALCKTIKCTLVNRKPIDDCFSGVAETMNSCAGFKIVKVATQPDYYGLTEY